MLIYPAGTTAACRFAAGCFPADAVTDHPSPDVTHLLLDVPSLSATGILRDGMPLQPILDSLPEDITVVGGNLTVPGYRVIDLLKDEMYLAENAAITAECALIAAGSRLECTLRGCPVLVIGWGRIGQCLCRLLQGIGADVTILIRKPEQQAIACALGYKVLPPERLSRTLPDFRLIFNTAPEVVLCETLSKRCRNCLKMDLASRPGILGPDVVTARGLPGSLAPESSGRLIARTLLRLTEGA